MRTILIAFLLSWPLAFAPVCCPLGSSCRAAEPAGPKVKFIELGWDIPSTAFLREHGAAMEKSAPMDGVMFKAEFRDDQGKALSSEAVWDAQPWKREWLEPAKSDLQACSFKRFTDNFVRFNATPGNLEWADDTGWQILAEKAGLCAWLCREGGATGLAIDFESYGSAQFRYDPAKGRSFPETVALARRRGGQMMQAMAAEYPDATHIALWLNSINTQAGLSDDPDAILAGGSYGLLPAFIDGLLDAMPPATTLVDGCELGYYMSGAEQYLRAAHQMRAWNGPALRLVASENRAKWRAQVQAGFGFYLDMYLNEEGSPYYFGPAEEGTRLDRLRENLSAARAASDGYVWIYGEQCRWWEAATGLADNPSVRKSVGKGRLWEEAMPGVTNAIRWARDVRSAALAMIEEADAKGQLVNLAKNADFAGEGPNRLPADWSTWQDEGSHGTMVRDAETEGAIARATGVLRGCFLQQIPVHAGEHYLVAADARIEGATTASLTIRWQRADGSWTHEPDDQTCVFLDAGQPWRRAAGLVTVPEDAAFLVVLLNVGQQQAEGDVCRFGHVRVHRVEPGER